MKWKVDCAAGCGEEVYEANSKDAAQMIAERKYDHDRVPHGNEIHWRIERAPDDAKVTQTRDVHIDNNRNITCGPWRDVK
jgi:hypothetical protein